MPIFADLDPVAWGSLVTSIFTAIGTGWVLWRQQKAKDRELDVEIQREEAQIQKDEATNEAVVSDHIIDQWKKHLEYVIRENGKAIKSLQDQNKEQQLEINRLMRSDHECRIRVAQITAILENKGIKIELPGEPK